MTLRVWLNRDPDPADRGGRVWKFGFVFEFGYQDIIIERLLSYTKVFSGSYSDSIWILGYRFSGLWDPVHRSLSLVHTSAQELDTIDTLNFISYICIVNLAGVRWEKN